MRTPRPALTLLVANSRNDETMPATREGSMSATSRNERIETVVIGAGQSGLSVGYHLARLGLPFVILDAGNRVGDSWRERWDSLRLFTPARFDGLEGMPFPASATSFPGKDAMADYLEAYATRFALPVRRGIRVDGLTRNGEGFVVSAGPRRFEAENVVVAMSHFQQPKVPSFAPELAPEIVQLHSLQYRGPSQLRDGPVLVVGAGNSGADIAMEVSRTHRTWLSGRHPGHVPFDIESFLGRHLFIRMVLRGLFHRMLTVRTPMGRRMRPKVLTQGGPLIRVKPKDLDAAGVQRVGRTAGVRDGRPVLEDGRHLDVANVIWCTGFTPGFSWIRLPGFDHHEPRHERGRVPEAPGLYFVGLMFLYALSSGMIHGVGRDAKRIARDIAARMRDRDAEPARARVSPAA
jgi:putative flavoprotein involved in K+ transport